MLLLPLRCWRDLRGKSQLGLYLMPQFHKYFGRSKAQMKRRKARQIQAQGRKMECPLS